MAFVAVDKDGAEAIYDEHPERHAVSWLPTKYRNGEYTEWIYLPKGSIAKLIGKELTWEDEPVELLPEESKEVTIEGWVARGANPHHLALYERKPDRLSDIWGFSHSLQLDPTSFPEVTWDTEPKRVKITITPIEE